MRLCQGSSATVGLIPKGRRSNADVATGASSWRGQPSTPTSIHAAKARAIQPFAARSKARGPLSQRTLILAPAGMFGWARRERTEPRPAAALPSIGKPHRDHRARVNYPVAVEPGRLVSKVKWSDGKLTRSLQEPNR